MLARHLGLEKLGRGRPRRATSRVLKSNVFGSSPQSRFGAQAEGHYFPILELSLGGALRPVGTIFIQVSPP